MRVNMTHNLTLPLRNNGKSYFTDTRAQFIPLHGVLFQ